ncbi:sulfotransferase 1B1-like isoform X1 [Dermacentor variabilis]|uniref:sulfotransferase 1B1-like isoform X1 n=2 Tax=Dermacentor variabilis TaxID=34621 RepID=UPI003F5C59E4
MDPFEERWSTQINQETPSRTGTTSSAPMDEDSYRYVEGMWLHKLFKDEAIISAVNYKPRQGDIFVDTYPKCGTNWMQFIVYNILTRAAPVTNLGEFRLMSPFIDMTGAAAAENPLRNGPVMTHFPYNVLRPVDRAKYIYVARNPYDCAVSFYHFIKGMTPKTVTDVSFEKFLNLYLAGKVLYGDYFDHLLPWYEHRGSKNILFITYEQLKADTRDQVLKIADFLGEGHGTSLRNDDELLQRVLHACSLESMKSLLPGKPQDVAKLMLKAAPEKSETFAMIKDMANVKEEMHEGSGFVRKGIVGDWRNYFTAEQLQRTKEWIMRKTQGSDVMVLWNDCDLP